MKTFIFRIAATFILTCTITVARGGELSVALEQYKEAISAALAAAPQNTPTGVVGYLQTCLTNATRLNGLDDSSPNVSLAFQDVARLRVAAFTALPPGTSGHPGVRAETKAFIDHLQSRAADNALEWQALQNELLSRKYFKTSTAKTSNFLEGFVNGNWKLTQADPALLRVTSPPRPLGVSPWEAIFRFEPTLALRGGPQAAILGAAGLSYTFFPTINNASPPTVRENFGSRTVKKSGVRLGAGAGRFDGKTRLLIGPGAQFNALGVWALYEPKNGAWMLGLSASDLSKLKKGLGWFD